MDKICVFRYVLSMIFFKTILDITSTSRDSYWFSNDTNISPLLDSFPSFSITSYAIRGPSHWLWFVIGLMIELSLCSPERLII